MVCLLLGGLQTKDARHSMRRWAIDANCLHLMAPLTLFKYEDVTPCWESSLRGVDGQQLQLAMGCFLVSVNVWIIALGGRGYNLVSRDLRGKKKDYRVPKRSWMSASTGWLLLYCHEGKNPILIRFAPKAHFRNFLWWGRSMHLLDASPYKVIGAALGCPSGVSKMAAEWQDLS